MSGHGGAPAAAAVEEDSLITALVDESAALRRRLVDSEAAEARWRTRAAAAEKRLSTLETADSDSRLRIRELELHLARAVVAKARPPPPPSSGGPSDELQRAADDAIASLQVATANAHAACGQRTSIATLTAGASTTAAELTRAAAEVASASLQLRAQLSSACSLGPWHIGSLCLFVTHRGSEELEALHVDCPNHFLSPESRLRLLGLGRPGIHVLGRVVGLRRCTAAADGLFAGLPAWSEYTLVDIKPLDLAAFSRGR